MGGIHIQLLESIATELDQHPDALRIRKLLFGTCYRRWENDPTTLQQLCLPSLLTQLIQQYPSAGALEQALMGIASSLNRPARYESLTHTLVPALTPVLPDHPAHSIAVPPPSAAATDDATEFMMAPPVQGNVAASIAPPAPLPSDAETARSDPGGDPGGTPEGFLAPASNRSPAPVPPGVPIAPASPPIDAASGDDMTIAAVDAVDISNNGTGGAGATVGKAGGAVGMAAPVGTTPSESPQLDSPFAATEQSAADAAAIVRSMYAEIARSLERHSEARRIRKLVYAVCFQTWENDMLVLESNAMVDLLEMLHTEYAAHSQVTVALNQRAATLNRSVTYLQVAHVISEALRSLYESGIQPPAHTARYAADFSPSPTNSLADSGGQTSFPADFALHEQTPVHESTQMVSNVGQPAQAQYEPTGIISADGLGDAASDSNYPFSYNSDDITVEPYRDVTATEPATHRDRQNLFDLRLNIMRYTNPLRAKLILFTSLFHTFDFSDQDWRSLQKYTLDDLVHQLFETYHTIDEVDVNLTRSAYALPHSDEQIPVLNTLLRAIAPYYPSA